MSESHYRIRTYEISRRVGEILHYLWDPIGVAEVPQTRDEYDSYLPQITGMLMRGAGEEEIAKQLTVISTETMGLTDTREGRKRDREIAELLIAHFAAVDSQFKKEAIPESLDDARPDRTDNLVGS